MWPWIVRQWRSVTAGEDEDPPDVPMKEIVSSHGLFFTLSSLYLIVLISFIILPNFDGHHAVSISLSTLRLVN